MAEKGEYKVGYGKPPLDKGNRFKPGESGNPKGRKKGVKLVSTILKELLDKKASSKLSEAKFVKLFLEQTKGKNVTNRDVLVARLMYNGLVKGDLKTMQEIIDRTEGKSQQSVDLTSKGEKLEITIGGKTFKV